MKSGGILRFLAAHVGLYRDTMGLRIGLREIGDGMDGEWLLKAIEFRPPEVGEPWCDGPPPRQTLMCRVGLHPSTFWQVVGLIHHFDVCNRCLRRVR